MDELPEGFSLPQSIESEPRKSASVMLSRVSGSRHEILMAHRISELPAFPELWSFPGGGVSRVDRKAAEQRPEWLTDYGSNRLQVFTLLREMVEEVGISPDGNGGFAEVGQETREMVCEDKSAWLEAVESGKLHTSGFRCQVITERTTPPQSPARFHNLFFHVDMGESGAEPTFPPFRSEFDEFRWWLPEDLISSWERNELHLPPPIVTLMRDIVEKIADSGDLISACNILASKPPSGPHRFEYGPGVECVLIPTETLPPATHTNCFILGERGGQRAVIDPAISENEGFLELSSKVDEIKADGSEIVCTIFTHKHRDHLGDLEMISKLYQAPVWASSETLAEVSPNEPFRELREGDSFELVGPNGISEWKVLETPGHCPGQICLVGDPGIVSADNCTMVGTILVPSGDGDMGDYIDGLERLRKLHPHTLFPGHGPLIPNPERILTDYINHRRERHSRVLEAVRSGNYSISKIVEYAYSDTPEAHPSLAQDQTLSHLKSLVKSGRLSHSNGLYKPL